MELQKIAGSQEFNSLVCISNVNFNVHLRPKLKLRLVLAFSSFVHNSSINEYKNMKLRENLCYEIIN